MANALYNNARQGFLEGAFNWMSDNVKAVLVTSGYTFSASHKHYNDVTPAARVTSEILLSEKTTTDGAADAADITFENVSGAQVRAIVLYVDTGTESTSSLIAYLDTATGLPITPNGGDIIVTWDNGANKIFKL